MYDESAAGKAASEAYSNGMYGESLLRPPASTPRRNTVRPRLSFSESAFRVEPLQSAGEGSASLQAPGREDPAESQAGESASAASPRSQGRLA